MSQPDDFAKSKRDELLGYKDMGQTEKEYGI